MALNGRAMTAVCVGTLFVWSGIKGWSLLGTASDLILGNAPSQAPINSLTAPGDSDSSGSVNGELHGATAVGSQIASTAVQHQGHRYVFGGAPGRDGKGPWDCSSFVNWIVGVKLGLAIPGYAPGYYNGGSHGPPTGMWGAWNGLTHIKREQVQAGDIVVWLDHMGIAISNSHMVNALNPGQGTLITPIEGYGNGPLLCYGRYGRVSHAPQFN